jgi:hypothetical protein
MATETSINGCTGYCRDGKYSMVEYPKNACLNCSFGQKSMSACTLVDGDWTDDYN